MMISGPTPAASPIVIATIGFFISTLVIQRRMLCVEARRHTLEFLQKLATTNERLWRTKCACLCNYRQGAYPTIGNRKRQFRFNFTEQSQLMDSKGIEDCSRRL